MTSTIVAASSSQADAALPPPIAVDQVKPQSQTMKPQSSFEKGDDEKRSQTMKPTKGDLTERRRKKGPTKNQQKIQHLIQLTVTTRRALDSATSYGAASSSSSAQARRTVDLKNIQKTWNETESHVRSLVSEVYKVGRSLDAEALLKTGQRFHEAVRQLSLLTARAREEQTIEMADAVTAMTVEVTDKLEVLSRLLHKAMNVSDYEKELALENEFNVSSPSLADLLQCAKSVALDLKQLYDLYKTSSLKEIRSSLYRRSGKCLVFAEMAQNFCRRTVGNSEQLKQVLDLASAVKDAGVRLFSVEANILAFESLTDAQVRDTNLFNKADERRKLLNACQTFSQLLETFMMILFETLKNSQAERNALMSLHTPIWEEVPLKVKDSSEIRKANANQLIILLTDLKAKSLKFQKAFFCTYRSIMSPSHLFTKLVERYNVPDHLQGPEALLAMDGVTVALRLWIENFPQDFDAALIEQLRKFADTLEEESQSKMLCDFLRLNITRIQTTHLLDVSVSLPPNVDPNDYIIGQPVNQIAQQLTLIDWQNFLDIRPSEFLQASWSKDRLKYRSPNVIKMIDRFHRVQQYVVSIIVSEESLAVRAAKMKKFIEVGLKLFSLKSYSAMSAIFAGLVHPAVKRLKHTSKMLNADLLAEFQQTSKQASSVNNYAALRQLLKHAKPPTLPPIGMFLIDLIMIEDRNEDWTEDGLVNWQKRLLVYDIIQQFQEFQEGEYTFESDPIFKVALDEVSLVEQDQAFPLSTEREPRGSNVSDLIP